MTKQKPESATDTPLHNHSSIWPRWLRWGAVGVFAFVIIVGIILFAQFITADDNAKAFVQEFGYLGVVITAFIAGLNAIVPVPAGSFVPIFVAAGLAMPLIILALVIGTMLADLLAFYIGMKGRELTIEDYPRVLAFTNWLRRDTDRYIIPGVFLYAALSPLPNELILVPLAIAGVRLRTLILPLLVGTIVYQTAFALGAQSLFTLVVEAL